MQLIFNDNISSYNVEIFAKVDDRTFIYYNEEGTLIYKTIEEGVAYDSTIKPLLVIP